MIFEEPRDGIDADAKSPRLCPLCETGRLIARHCKLVCDSCGYVESCEDNFIPNFANPRESAANE